MPSFSTIYSAVDALARGEVIIAVDAEKRCRGVWSIADSASGTGGFVVIH